MCYNTKLTKSTFEIERRFGMQFEAPEAYQTSKQFNGFTRPFTPIISDSKTGLIELAQWGLIPQWNRENKMTYNTLNARIETLSTSKLWKRVAQNRCLAIVDGFYEWQWADPTDKKSKKTKYLLTYPENEIFTIGSIYSDWTDNLGNTTRTYSLVMTEANELLAEIHNSVKRMPVVLRKDQEQVWLDGEPHILFEYPAVELRAEIVQ